MRALFLSCLLFISVNSFAGNFTKEQIVGLPQKTICGIENVEYSFTATLDRNDPIPNPLLMKDEYFSYGATSVKTCDYRENGDDGIAVVALFNDGRASATIFSLDLIN